MSRLLKRYRRVAVLRLEVIYIRGFIPFLRIGCQNRSVRVCFIGSVNLSGTRHGNAVIITGSPFRAHKVIITVPAVKMRAFQTAASGCTIPDSFRHSCNCFFLRGIFGKADCPRFPVTVPRFPFQRNNPFPPVLPVIQRRVKAGRMQIYRCTPWPPDVRRADQIIVNVKVTGIHGSHHAIDDIEQIFLPAVRQTGCPDSLGRGKPRQFHSAFLCQNMGIQLPVLHIAGMINGNPRKPFKGGECKIKISVFSAQAGVAVKTGKNRIVNHDKAPSYLKKQKDFAVTAA